MGGADARRDGSWQAAAQDRGQAALVVVIVTAVLFVAALTGLSALGARVTDQARAQSVADAAALASVESGRLVAEGLVARAGAERGVVESRSGSGRGDRGGPAA